MVITGDSEAIVVRLEDWGKVYDPAAYIELPDELPERGMGLFIIRSFMDELTYAAGPPNVLTLKKRWPSAAQPEVSSAGESPARINDLALFFVAEGVVSRIFPAPRGQRFRAGLEFTYCYGREPPTTHCPAPRRIGVATPIHRRGGLCLCLRRGL